MQGCAKSQQVSSALFNKDMVLVTTLSAVKPNVDQFKKCKNPAALRPSLTDLAPRFDSEQPDRQ